VIARQRAGADSAGLNTIASAVAGLPTPRGSGRANTRPMSDDDRLLGGSLEQVGDRWIIGAPKLEGSSRLVLTAEGTEHHEHRDLEPSSRGPGSWNWAVRATDRAWGHLHHGSAPAAGRAG
jgi:hypothetical protein